ncbi:hypothetical protein [Achromobacter ruhlandii]|nr:hypothetical protein [Achromobacter ruhlandii]
MTVAGKIPSEEDKSAAIQEAEQELNVYIADLDDGDPALDLVLDRAGEILKSWGFIVPKEWKASV